MASLAQVRLNTSSQEILQEFEKEGIIQDTNTSGAVYLMLDADYWTVYYTINEASICTQCFIVPADNEVINYFVEKYNKNYVVIGIKEWRSYYGADVASIVLKETEDGEAFFLWEMME
ncbi:MAG: hypothetical protein B7C24_12790 [Bacteroidetes bacterium 4572_77]|nr:MAG: hypothetical protein B7C24_12790 [Bacteroidetes bacterium 4572_77]